MIARDYQSACHDAVLKLWGIEPWASRSLWPQHYKLADSLGSAPWECEPHGQIDPLVRLGPHRSLLLALGTAGGKTIIDALLIKTLAGMGARILFCADTDELCAQPLEKIFKVTGLRPGLEKANARARVSATRHSSLVTRHSPNVCVASVQTLADPPRLRDFAARWGSPDFIIHDEAHNAPERAADINAQFPDARILGQTATPFRRRCSNLERWYGHVAFQMEATDLIEQGWIAPISVQAIDLFSGSGFQPENFINTDKMSVPQIARKIAPVYRKVARLLKQGFCSRRILAFHPLIKSSKLFTDICRSEGLSAAHCDGNSRRRWETIAAFERGDVQVLSNSNVFSTGVDFIRADCLLNLDLTRSVGKYRQRVGRILRVMPGIIENLASAAERCRAISISEKPDALILDLLGHNEKFGIAGAAHFLARDEQERCAIAQRITREPQQLHEIQADIVRRKEEALIRELQRKHGPKVDTSLYISTRLDPNRFAPQSKEAKIDALLAAMME